MLKVVDITENHKQFELEIHSIRAITGGGLRGPLRWPLQGAESGIMPSAQVGLELMRHGMPFQTARTLSGVQIMHCVLLLFALNVCTTWCTIQPRPAKAGFTLSKIFQQWGWNVCFCLLPTQNNQTLMRGAVVAHL